MFDYYFFDLDGTLTDPGEGITNSVAYALAKFGITVEDRRQLYVFIGPPLLDAFARYYGFSEKEAETAVRYYREYYREKGLYENKLYEEIPGVLARLKARGKILALATSKPEPFARQILANFDLDRYFDFAGGATFDPSRSRKADVIRYVLDEMQITDRSQVLMVGDRSHDVLGAKENGLASMGVLYGYGNIQELKEAGADFIAGTPEEIILPDHIKEDKERTDNV